jgi:hypothetical protein
VPCWSPTDLAWHRADPHHGHHRGELGMTAGGAPQCPQTRARGVFGTFASMPASPAGAVYRTKPPQCPALARGIFGTKLPAAWSFMLRFVALFCPPLVCARWEQKTQSPARPLYPCWPTPAAVTWASHGRYVTFQMTEVAVSR